MWSSTAGIYLNFKKNYVKVSNDSCPIDLDAVYYFSTDETSKPKIKHFHEKYIMI